MPVPVEFVPADAAVRRPVTKVGGQPVWIEEPQWPLSRESGRPMEFLGQFELGDGRLGYLFMTASQDGGEASFEPEGGENALIVQPAGRVPDFVVTAPAQAGPSAGEDFVPRSVEPAPDGEEWQFLGGPGVLPNWLQGGEEPGEGWQLIAQLDSAGLPFHVDFGDMGVGYAFLSPDGKEGRFLWQCG